MKFGIFILPSWPEAETGALAPSSSASGARGPRSPRGGLGRSGGAGGKGALELLSARSRHLAQRDAEPGRRRDEYRHF
jgi:hypothetical protein